MKTMTNSFQEFATYLLMITIFCACAVAYPSTLTEKSTFGKIQSLIDQIKHELGLNDNLHVKNDIGMTDLDISKNAINPAIDSHYGSLNMLQSHDSQSKPLLSSLLLKNADDKTFDVMKRQGSWDYDYGLGGGRFGKRAGYWADYSLGGGRFGRDVDHVSNMADAQDVDFEDPME